MIDHVLAIGGVAVSMASFLFTFTVWRREKNKEKITRTQLEDIYVTADTTLADAAGLGASVKNIHRIAGRALAIQESFSSLSEDKIWIQEKDPSTIWIWLYSPDLEPDRSYPHIGKRVRANLRRGKRYIYFYPNTLAYAEEKEAALRRNIGAVKKYQNRVQLVPVGSSGKFRS